MSIGSCLRDLLATRLVCTKHEASGNSQSSDTVRMAEPVQASSRSHAIWFATANREKYSVQNNRLTIRTGLVSARPIVQDQDRLILSSSAKAPNSGGRSGLSGPTRSADVFRNFATVSGGTVGSAIRFMLAPETHSAPSSPIGNWSTIAGVRFARKTIHWWPAIPGGRVMRTPSPRFRTVAMNHSRSKRTAWPKSTSLVYKQYTSRRKGKLALSTKNHLVKAIPLGVRIRATSLR